MIQQGATVGARLEKVGKVWWWVKLYLPWVLGGLAVVSTAILALIYVPKIWVPDLYWLSPRVRFDMLNEARRTVAYIIGGVLAVVGIGLTIWRNWIAQEGQITERFTRAIEQLGSKEMAIRLGGIYALERIANDSDKDYWSIMETLTAYVRERAPWGEPSHMDYELASGEKPAPYEAKPEIKPTTDIQAILTIIGRRKSRYDRGEKQHLYLRGTDLRGAILRDAHLEGADLLDVHLEKAALWGAHLEGALLFGTHLEGAILFGADLSNATGLTWERLTGAFMDEKTRLPDYLQKEPPQGKGPEGDGKE